jgi:hypothetical protein
MLRHAILCGVLCLAPACGADSPTSPTDRDWIEIVSITPARGAVLSAGQPLSITLTASVTVASKDGGHAVLVVIDQANRTLNNPAGPQSRVTLTKGRANVTIADTVTVPPAGSTLSAAAVLFVDGSNATRALQRVTFTVQ